MAGQVRGWSPTEYGLPTRPKLSDVEITQACNLDVERFAVRQSAADLNARHGASARPSPGLTWLALAAVAVCDLIDAMAVDLFRSELQREALAHHTGQEAPNRVLLPAGHLHH